MAVTFTNKGRNEELPTLIRLLLELRGRSVVHIGQSDLGGLPPGVKEKVSLGLVDEALEVILDDFDAKAPLELQIQGTA